MRILLVEDNDNVAGFVLKGLKEESYGVDWAKDGREGLRMAMVSEYDLLILDLMLPGIDGIRIAKVLRQNGHHVPILMLTARTTVSDRVEGLDSGADDYLTKPFAFTELLARIRALVRRASRQTVDPILSLADLTLDPASHRVSRGGDRVELTPREYAILELLLRNCNRILTRSTIVDHVWDMSFDGDTQLVDSHIHHLRRKVDEGRTPKLIHTIRGVGYMMGLDPA